MTSVYAAYPVKRQRRTRAELEAIHAALYEYAQRYQPVTVRQLFYAMTVQGIVPKEERGYDVIQRELVKLREAGAFPYHWIADSSRWIRKRPSFNRIEEALLNTVQTYRRALWASAEVYVEVWCEKEALSGVLAVETSRYDVPLMVSRGFSSVSYLYSTAAHMRAMGKPSFIYYLGDHDPSGVTIPRKIEEGLRRHAPDTEIHFERVAINPEQIEAWGLQTRPTKKTDSRAKNFEGESCELDALPPEDLRRLVRGCIERHMSPWELTRQELAEADERETWAATFGQLLGMEGEGCNA